MFFFIDQLHNRLRRKHNTCRLGHLKKKNRKAQYIHPFSVISLLANKSMLQTFQTFYKKHITTKREKDM